MEKFPDRSVIRRRTRERLHVIRHPIPFDFSASIQSHSVLHEYYPLPSELPIVRRGYLRDHTVKSTVTNGNPTIEETICDDCFAPFQTNIVNDLIS